ncbi:MAG: mannan-binding lectin [Desulfovibrionaceae bacterium]|nr:mannan-binding lectin [Desulfovibrionaceae bacterium]
MVFGLAYSAQAYDVRAGPIWNNEDAKTKCPPVCANYKGWNGQWTTTVQGQMSVCGCNEPPTSGNPHDKNAGPIWNNGDAQTKCPPACHWYGGWNGQWTTTVPGQMSVCGCNEAD